MIEHEEIKSFTFTGLREKKMRGRKDEVPHLTDLALALCSPVPFNGVYMTYTVLFKQGASVPRHFQDGGLVRRMLYQPRPLQSPLVYMCVLLTQNIWPGQAPSAPHFIYM